MQFDIPETDKESSSDDDSDGDDDSSTDLDSESDSEEVDNTLADAEDEEPRKTPTEKRSQKDVVSNIEETEAPGEKPTKKSRKQIRAEKEAGIADLTLPQIPEKEVDRLRHHHPEEPSKLYSQAETDLKLDDEEKLSTPLPSETVALFYARSRRLYLLTSLDLLPTRFPPGPYWVQKALDKANGATEKELRGVAFALAKDRYGRPSYTSSATNTDLWPQMNISPRSRLWRGLCLTLA